MNLYDKLSAVIDATGSSGGGGGGGGGGSGGVESSANGTGGARRRRNRRKRNKKSEFIVEENGADDDDKDAAAAVSVVEEEEEEGAEGEKKNGEADEDEEEGEENGIEMKEIVHHSSGEEEEEGEGEGEEKDETPVKQPDRGLFPPPLKLERSEKAGRYVTATADIPSGALVYIAKPFGVTVFDSHKKRFCRGCCTFSETNYSVHCTQCRQMWYCSSECLLKDRNFAHKFECPIVRRTASCKLQMYDIGTVRVLLHIFAIREAEDEQARLKAEATSTSKPHESGQQQQQQQQQQEQPQQSGESGDGSVVDVWNRPSWHWPDFADLCTNGPYLRGNADKLRDASDVTRWVYKAINAAHAAKEGPYLIRTYPFDEIMDQLSRIESNAFNIAISSCKEAVGEAVFVSIAFINHACEANCEVIYSADPGIPLCLHSRSYIKAGSEITIAYIDNDKTTAVRRSELKDKYFFDCECEMCRNNIDGRPKSTTNTETTTTTTTSNDVGEEVVMATTAATEKKGFKHKQRQHKKQKKPGVAAARRKKAAAAKKKGKK
eukprot:TRINITY_DN2511_c2_g1_i1.p1 TRINITY_DN2511_c2_g1~~TRINITY_DN2511_c2_g1_i1.p1  ORF type:complete len:548 (-),score=148.91 TRINITY_DN2511_c2_g1_i1:343-1986(-)